MEDYASTKHQRNTETPPLSDSTDDFEDAQRISPSDSGASPEFRASTKRQRNTETPPLSDSTVDFENAQRIILSDYGASPEFRASTKRQRNAETPPLSYSTDDFEDAQRISLSDSYASAEFCTSMKRQHVAETPPLFDSPEPEPSQVGMTADPAIFPSDISSPESSLNISPLYPSDQEELECRTSMEDSTYTNGDVSSEMEDTATFERGLTPDTAHVMPTHAIESSLGSSFGSFTTACQYDSDELDRVANVLVSPCCANECLLPLTAHDVLAARRRFCSLGRCAQRQWLTDRLNENSCEEEKGKLSTTYSIAGTNVCQSSWCKVYMVSQRRILRVLKSVQEGKVVIEHGNKGKHRSNTKSESAIAWMQRYVHLVGDKMPHNDQIHLPSWETQKDVYARYAEDMKLQQVQPSVVLSLSMFYKVWKDEFSHVVIPEQNRFAKCDMCVKIKMDRKGCLDKQKQAQLKVALREHLARVETERKKYHHREKSRSCPLKCVTIIIDGMDQAKTNLPNMKIISKSTSALWRLRTHVTGVLIHTKAPCGKLAFAYIDLLQWPHDSNLTITLLLNSLLEFQKNYPLPATLYLQMDNTSRENKNKFVLGFCAILVELRIFQKVQINFLPVGHTHEDIDQLFSKIAEEIRRAGCESLSDLLHLIHRSSTPNPDSKMISQVWDFKKWMDPFLGTVTGHSKYLAFRFTLDSSSRAEMHYKRFSSSPWEPQDSGIHILVGCPDVTGEPPLVVPSSDKVDLDRFVRDLQKYKTWLSSAAWEQWEKFVANSRELSELTSDRSYWELPVLVSAAITASCVRKQQVSETLSDSTTRLMEKETAAPAKISVKHKGTKRQTTVSVQDSSRQESEKENGDETGGNVAVIEPTTTNSDAEDNFIVNHQTLEVGMTVACFMLCYVTEEPQIGKVVSIDESHVEVEWMTGTYCEPWVVCKRTAGRICTTWREKITIDAVLFPIELTSSSRIPSAIKEKLKKAYELKRAH